MKECCRNVVTPRKSFTRTAKIMHNSRISIQMMVGIGLQNIIVIFYKITLYFLHFVLSGKSSHVLTKLMYVAQFILQFLVAIFIVSLNDCPLVFLLFFM